MPFESTRPRVIISARASKSLKAGASWVYATEIIHAPGRFTSTDASFQAAPSLENGSIVDVFDEKGTWRGAAFFSNTSTLALRIVSTCANDVIDEAFWQRRMVWAWQHRVNCLRARSLPGSDDTHSCRVIFSEADGFPGFTVDRYEHVLVVQITTAGIDRIKDLLYALLIKVLREAGEDIRAIYERLDSPLREKEGLPLTKGWYQAPALALDIPESSHVSVSENGLLFDIDIEHSQKTGFFLDQKYTRRAIRPLARNKRVLDCFTHVGPFALNACAGGASYVRAVDISAHALDLALCNARLNHMEDRIETTCANVLDYLPRLVRDRAYLKAEGGPFDFIILDPPAFTKSKKARAHASTAYEEINYYAMRLLGRGGYLATASCSHYMSTELLKKAISRAALRANVSIKQVAYLQQAPDHPIVWGMDETHYLDFFIVQIV